MERSESQEMYLKTIYLLTQKKWGVRHIDVANELGLSKPSVTNALKKLVAGGDIVIDDNYVISLTEKGKERAEKICMRYDAFKSMFIAMHVPEDKAHEAACKIEHDITDEVFGYIKTWIENQKTAN